MSANKRHDPRSVIESLKEARQEIEAMPAVPAPMKRERSPVPVEVDPEEWPTPDAVEEEPEEEEEFDLERELERLNSQYGVQPAVEVEPEPVAAPVSETESIRLQVLALLHNREDAPTAAQITAWKDKYGTEAIQLMSLDVDNVYIYTHLTWGQWEGIQKLSESIQQRGGGADAEKAMREAVIRAAVLWPKLPATFFQNCRAGLPQTLMDQIMMASYWLTPQQSVLLTTRL